jgi:hypothetical protein
MAVVYTGDGSRRDGSRLFAPRGATRTSVRIQTETYGFARQKTHGWSMNLILISCMSFLVDFRPKRAFE